MGDSPHDGHALSRGLKAVLAKVVRGDQGHGKREYHVPD